MRTAAAERFEEWWQTYPRRKSKDAAIKAWKRLKCDDIADVLIQDIAKRKELEWAGKEPQFIPYPATYLNGKQWNDDIEDNRHENRSRTGGNGRPTFDDKIRRLREAADEGEPGVDTFGRNARGPILARVR